MSWYLGLTGGDTSPLAYQRCAGKKGFIGDLVDLSEIRGFNSWDRKLLGIHSRRLFGYDFRSTLIGYLLFVIVILLLARLNILPIVTWLGLNRNPNLFGLNLAEGTNNPVVGTLYYVGSIISFIVLLKLFWRISHWLIDRPYADSLCIRAVIYLYAELHREVALDTPSRKAQLLSRLNRLSAHTYLLMQHYSKRVAYKQTWLPQHFEFIRDYIEERASWVIAPQATTLAKLRSDFDVLAQIFITERYGDFKWSEEMQNQFKAEKNVAPTGKPASGIISGLSRVIGVLLPVAIVVFLITQQLYTPQEQTLLDLLGKSDVPPNTVLGIGMAWFLLAIDKALNLGLVSSVVDLAKGVKEIST